MSVDPTPLVVATVATGDERVRSLDDHLQRAITAAAQLWRDERGIGVLAARLVDVNHALERASLALGDGDLIGRELDGNGSDRVVDARPIASRSTAGVLDAHTLAQPVAWSMAERLVLSVDTIEEYAIFLLDLAGTVMSWNHGAHRIKGYTGEEAVGQHFSIFYTAEDIDAGKPHLELALAADQGQCRDDGWRVRKDGSRFWASVVITALFDDTGSVAGFSKVTRDETERKETEHRAQHRQRIEDREHIGSGLNDTIVHRIFEAGLDLHAALQLVTDPVAGERIEHAIGVLDGTVKEIRIVVLGLDGDDMSTSGDSGPDGQGR